MRFVRQWGHDKVYMGFNSYLALICQCLLTTVRGNLPNNFNDSLDKVGLMDDLLEEISEGNAILFAAH